MRASVEFPCMTPKCACSGVDRCGYICNMGFSRTALKVCLGWTRTTFQGRTSSLQSALRGGRTALIGERGHDHPRVREQGRFQGRAQTTAFSATRRWHIGVGRVSWNRSYYHDSNRVNGFHALFFTFLGHDREAGQSATYHLRAAKILNLLHFRVLLQSGENSTPRLQPFSMQNMVKDVWS